MAKFRTKDMARRLGSGKKTWRFPSVKMNETRYGESRLERDYFYFLEFDGDVLAYYEQPFQILYLVEGKKHHYTPDILVIRRRVRQIVEVKPEMFINTPEVKTQIEVGLRYCQENGYEHVLATDKMIYSGCILANLKEIYRFNRMKIPFQVEYAALGALAQAPMTRDDLTKHLTGIKPGQKMDSYVYALIAQRKIQCSFQEPFEGNSIVRLP